MSEGQFLHLCNSSAKSGPLFCVYSSSGGASRSAFSSEEKAFGTRHSCQRTVGADSIRPPQQRNGKIRSSPTGMRYKSLRDVRYALRHDIRLRRAICALRERSGRFSCRRISDLNPSSGSLSLTTFCGVAPSAHLTYSDHIITNIPKIAKKKPIQTCEKNV